MQRQDYQEKHRRDGSIYPRLMQRALPLLDDKALHGKAEITFAIAQVRGRTTDSKTPETHVFRCAFEWLTSTQQSETLQPSDLLFWGVACDAGWRR
jgi:hypothetical protein